LKPCVVFTDTAKSTGVQTDLVEPGEVVVIAGHAGVGVGDAGFVSDDVDVGGGSLSVEPDLDLLAGAQIANPAEWAADQESFALTKVATGSV
jgi:hypothetical protein